MNEEELRNCAVSLGVDTKGLLSDFWDRRDYELHPLFRDTEPTEEELQEDALLLGLAQLRDDLTVEETMMLWKNEGNEYFAASKGNKVSLFNAIKAYSKGISVSDDLTDPVGSSARILRSQLFSNRATCYYRLNFITKCLDDSRAAIRENPKNPKGYFHAYRCSLLLELKKEAYNFCDLGCKLGEGKEVSVLEAKRQELSKEVEELEKRRNECKQKDEQQLKCLQKVLHSRKFEYIENLPFPTAPFLKPSLVHKEVVGWPILFLIVEKGLIETIKHWDERLPLEDALKMMFPEAGPYADWDSNCEYKWNCLNIHHYGDTGNPIDRTRSLRDVLDDLPNISTYPCFSIKLK
eukprot:Gregarina_sp_Poly_1__8768@NODE_525_length_7703_cov_51_704164_g416_i0_p2_GENE_NODE_525_length_7703_cov_51_704164_g416_i0NODE_525_length_7703_cov_51_704164_g416_i0_p2_ORF_typecomplete_len350_score48_54ANAPC3/PF12895_7/7_1e06Spc7/PF08317_11/0_048TPR_2/PF07719_17/3_1e02TPR_2/PF07719_17/6_8e02TPR_2/PF07719_17/2_7Nup88/PF10168_9/0_055TPR_11/PF13414_6/6_5TPR_11/PF13414_6/2_1e02ZapB/PF06005_12/0_65XkdW/PF09636_10/46XkdW/PF09636_10/1_9e02XkdW/PF09636_10/99DUF3086/PF11285_8/0_71DUF3552/PF12072_8/1L_lactis